MPKTPEQRAQESRAKARAKRAEPHRTVPNGVAHLESVLQWLLEDCGQDYDEDFIRPNELVLATVRALIRDSVGEGPCDQFGCSTIGDGGLHLYAGHDRPEHFALSIRPNGSNFVYYAEDFGAFHNHVWGGVDDVTAAELEKWFEWVLIPLEP